MDTIVQAATGTVSKITVAPACDQIRIKICKSDLLDKDMILELAYIIAREYNHSKTFRCKVRKLDGKMFVSKGVTFIYS